MTTPGVRNLPSAAAAAAAAAAPVARVPFATHEGIEPAPGTLFSLAPGAGVRVRSVVIGRGLGRAPPGSRDASAHNPGTGLSLPSMRTPATALTADGTLAASSEAGMVKEASGLLAMTHKRHVPPPAHVMVTPSERAVHDTLRYFLPPGAQSSKAMSTSSLVQRMDSRQVSNALLDAAHARMLPAESGSGGAPTSGSNARGRTRPASASTLWSDASAPRARVRSSSIAVDHVRSLLSDTPSEAPSESASAAALQRRLGHGPTCYGGARARALLSGEGAASALHFPSRSASVGAAPRDSGDDTAAAFTSGAGRRHFEQRVLNDVVGDVMYHRPRGAHVAEQEQRAFYGSSKGGSQARKAALELRHQSHIVLADDTTFTPGGAATPSLQSTYRSSFGVRDVRADPAALSAKPCAQHAVARVVHRRGAGVSGANDPYKATNIY